ncbi:hypothetical protein niasHT_026131 [Heterodera trifolii]|uniref:Uncharacterized protein n=1 Tax=Heterodera trifolii TaxID=157864 RepID=A0ABD2KRB8_9BILA
MSPLPLLLLLISPLFFCTSVFSDDILRFDPAAPPAKMPSKSSLINLSKKDQVTLDEILISLRQKSPIEQTHDMKAFAQREGGLMKVSGGGKKAKTKRKAISVENRRILEEYAKAVEKFKLEMAPKLEAMSLKEARSCGDHVLLIITDPKLADCRRDAQKELKAINLADAGQIVQKGGPFLNGPAFWP